MLIDKLLVKQWFLIRVLSNAWRSFSWKIISFDNGNPKDYSCQILGDLLDNSAFIVPRENYGPRAMLECYIFARDYKRTITR